MSADDSSSASGSPRRRHEKVTGAAQYTADIRLPGMLHAMMKRSPHAHARIVNIDASRAARLPGVEAVLTLRDVPRVRHAGQPEPRAGSLVNDQYILADTVRFLGDGVAAVAAVARMGRRSAGSDRRRVRGAARRVRPVRGDDGRGAFHPRHRTQPGHPARHHCVGRRGGGVCGGRSHLRRGLYLTARPGVHGAVHLHCRPEPGGK